MKTWAFESVKVKVSSLGLELMGRDAEVRKWLLLPASLTFFFPIFPRGEDFIADFVCCGMHNVWLWAHSQGFSWNLAAFSAAWVKPSAETWREMSWRWNKVSHQFVLLLSVWAGYLPTQETVVCRSLKFWNCRQGGAGWWSNVGIAGESPAKENQGEWACSCCFLAFPLHARPSLAQLSGQTCLVTVQPAPVFFMRFEAIGAAWASAAGAAGLASPAFTRTPRRLPSPCPSPSIPTPSFSCQGSLLLISQRAGKAFVNHGRLFWSRLCGPIPQCVSCQGGGHHWLCWCWPSNQHQERNSELLSFKCFEAFSGKKLDSYILSSAAFI